MKYLERRLLAFLMPEGPTSIVDLGKRTGDNLGALNKALRELSRRGFVLRAGDIVRKTEDGIRKGKELRALCKY